MTKTIRICNMCGQQPAPIVPTETNPTPMPPMWIVLDHPGKQEGEVITPGNYDLCSEACLQSLVAGNPPLGEKDVTVTPAISRATA